MNLNEAELIFSAERAAYAVHELQLILHDSDQCAELIEEEDVARACSAVMKQLKPCIDEVAELREVPPECQKMLTRVAQLERVFLTYASGK
jgi:hypothetical protein